MFPQNEFSNFQETEEDSDYERVKIQQKRAIARELKEKKLKKLKHTQVCTFWMQGLCKKGENCPFLHSYDKNKLPVCKSILAGQPCMKLGSCPFLHDISAQFREECPYYARGFCKLGRFCKNLHIPKKLCQNYLLGFCIKGPKCKDEHLRPLISAKDSVLEKLSKLFKVEQKKDPKKFKSYICHRCGERGHSDDGCKNEKIPKEQLYEILMSDSDYMKKSQSVICYKCSELGHYTIMCEVFTERRKKKQRERSTKTPSHMKVLSESFGETVYNCGQIFKACERYLVENPEVFNKIN